MLLWLEASMQRVARLPRESSRSFFRWAQRVSCGRVLRGGIQVALQGRTAASVRSVRRRAPTLCLRQPPAPGLTTARAEADFEGGMGWEDHVFSSIDEG